MTHRLKEIIEVTGKSADEIRRNGGESYLERELRDARIRDDELRETFGVDTPAELAALIEHGQVSEHLAADELREWQELRIRIIHLENL